MTAVSVNGQAASPERGQESRHAFAFEQAVGPNLVRRATSEQDWAALRQEQRADDEALQYRPPPTIAHLFIVDFYLIDERAHIGTPASLDLGRVCGE
jgi:hypothetical protein